MFLQSVCSAEILKRLLNVADGTSDRWLLSSSILVPRGESRLVHTFELSIREQSVELRVQDQLIRDCLRATQTGVKQET